MTNPSGDLADLLARVKAAEGADRELDGAIAVTVDGFWTEPSRRGEDELDYIYRDPGGSVIRPGYGGLQLVRHYTASLDQALALCERVLPGCVREVCERNESETGRTWSAALYPMRGRPRIVGKRRPTPALAILAATLRALIAGGTPMIEPKNSGVEVGERK